MARVQSKFEMSNALSDLYLDLSFIESSKWTPANISVQREESEESKDEKQSWWTWALEWVSVADGKRELLSDIYTFLWDLF